MSGAILQGVPATTLDTDLWIDLPSRSYMRMINLARAQGATMAANTVVELVDGALVDFRLDGEAGAGSGPAGSKITVFTTRIDTIYGATSVQLAPEHPLVADLKSGNPELAAGVAEMLAEQNKAREVGDIGNIEKHGVFSDGLKGC